MRGGEVKGVERKRARGEFNTKLRQTNTRVSTSLLSEIHSTQMIEYSIRE